MRRRQIVCKSQIFLEQLQAAADNRLTARIADALSEVRALNYPGPQHSVPFHDHDRFGTIKALHNHAAVPLHLPQELTNPAYRADPVNLLRSGGFVLNVFLHAQEDQVISRSCLIRSTYRRFAFHIKRQGHLRKRQHSARGDHRQLCDIIRFDFFIHCFASILQSRGLPKRPAPAFSSFVILPDPGFGKPSAIRLPGHCLHR